MKWTPFSKNSYPKHDKQVLIYYRSPHDKAYPYAVAKYTRFSDDKDGFWTVGSVEDRNYEMKRWLNCEPIMWMEFPDAVEHD